jgi:hypothetical protein
VVVLRWADERGRAAARQIPFAGEKLTVAVLEQTRVAAVQTT